MSSPSYGHPEPHRAFGRDIIYTIILICIYDILLYIELRESQTATITFSSMLQYTPDCTALSLTVERWLAVTLHMSLSGHAVERWLAVITRNSCQSWNLSRHKSLWTRSPVHGKSVARQIKKIRPIRVYTFTLYGILSSRCVWCERTGEVSRQTAKIDIFIQKIAGPFASYKKHVCDTGYRYGYII